MNSALDTRDSFIQVLNRFLKKERLSNLYFADAVPPPSGSAAMHDCSRLYIILSGTKRMRFAHKGTIIERNFTPKDALWTEPYGWNQECWNTDHSLISCVFKKDFLRILLIEHSKAHPIPGVPARKIWFHTPRGIPFPATSMIHILNDYSMTCLPEDPRSLSVFKALLYEIRNELQNTMVLTETSKALDTYKTIKMFVEENYNQAISRKTVANHFNLNPCYVSRLFKHVGQNGFNDFLTGTRLHHAQFYLKNKSLSIQQIAELCGFSSSSYFIKVFAKAYGMSPGESRS